jgi:hypothetical protein
MKDLRERITAVVTAAVAVSLEPRLGDMELLTKAVQNLGEIPITETNGEALEWGLRWKQRAKAAEAEIAALRKGHA